VAPQRSNADCCATTWSSTPADRESSPLKDDVREVQTGYECGIGLERYNDLKRGHVIERFRMEEIKRTFESTVPARGPSQASAL